MSLEDSISDLLKRVTAIETLLNIRRYENDLLKALFPPSIQPTTKHSYMVVFDEEADLWRSSAIMDDKVFCSSVGYTQIDAFDNLMVKI